MTRPRRKLMARSNTKTSRTNEQTPIGIINRPPSRSTPSRLLVGIDASLRSLSTVVAAAADISGGIAGWA